MSGAVSACFIAANEIYRIQETSFLDPEYFTLRATSADYFFWAVCAVETGGESVETWEVAAMIGMLLVGIVLILVMGGIDE